MRLLNNLYLLGAVDKKGYGSPARGHPRLSKLSASSELKTIVLNPIEIYPNQKNTPQKTRLPRIASQCLIPSSALTQQYVCGCSCLSWPSHSSWGSSGITCRYFSPLLKRLISHKLETGELLFCKLRKNTRSIVNNCCTLLFTQSNSDTESEPPRKRQISAETSLPHAAALLQQRGDRHAKDAAEERGCAQPDDGPLDDDGNAQGKPHQRAPHDRHRRMDQLALLGLRDHKGSLPTDPPVQADAAARHRAHVSRRIVGLVCLVVLPERLWPQEHLCSRTWRK